MHLGTYVENPMLNASTCKIQKLKSFPSSVCKYDNRYMTQIVFFQIKWKKTYYLIYIVDYTSIIIWKNIKNGNSSVKITVNREKIITLNSTTAKKDPV